MRCFSEAIYYKVGLPIMMKYEFLKILINFCRKYKKEILWWIFVIIVSQRIDYDRFAYKPEDYKPKNESKNPEE